ncbi:hypothetical protein AXG93_4877s1120 [Marchantia polymorpha subsp. ruderalis]|uniref:Enoyl reductase (ER) domain-containing protein n=1 Tax=Marchantia polymorpha subsp. ruderalis TaxID=1480154 RepID=A0A176WBK8_MARPO|nr:hypothetical protein AXG93_4877s1120 [Marchantia polymorpha subsp. ruderalis]
MASEIEVIGWAARDTLGHMAPITFSRRALGPRDVKFFIKFCGVCHSDWTVISGEVYNPTFPVVPGHEIVGVVDEVGSEVTKFKVGDHAAVSAYVNSCGSCRDCERKLPQHCKGKVRVYDSVNPADGLRTYGGYSNLMVVDESFCLVLPKNLPLDGAAPLLCAGATVWSPMKRYGMGKNGDRFGVVGLGGLGHIALKFAKALGMHATVISTSPAKEKMAREELGADNFIVSKDTKQMEVCPFPPPIFSYRNKDQEMLDFCGEKNLVCTIEKIPIDYINEAFKRMLKGDVHFRFVIDVGNTLKPQN